MASLAAELVDPTKAGKYPVILSDALLGKDPKELFTGIRYNHKPSLSSSSAPHQARIKPATSSSSTSNSYDLSFQDDGGRYAYNGTRGPEDRQYVLIFDPERQAFVLHKVDSIFNMNLVRTPSNSDADALRQEYPPLAGHKESAAKSKSKASAKDSKASKDTAPKTRKPAAAKPKAGGALVMPSKSAPPKPAPAPPKPAKKAAPNFEDDEDSSDDDGLLTIEDPGGAPPASASRDFSPGFIDRPRRFSEFVQQNDSEEQEQEEEEGEEEANDDADGEDDEDDVEHFTLPSPLGGQGSNRNNGNFQPEHGQEMEDDDEEMEDVNGAQGGYAGDLDEEMDLEAALMAELGEDEGGGGGGGEDKEESDVSEEE
ncbi:RNA polymerase II transcription elongation factor-domain-containing protein [Xylariomycetidae sp. FL0641]|nr:RNA polymerase II transcription elongation factor-domain-containing protein [Xylariomycetidae sp. FL0641]